SESLFARVVRSAKSTPEIGICTGIGNYALVRKAGYAFMEEGVRGFLVPSEPESVFFPILEKAKRSPVPVTACNSFLPGNMKSVGPDQATGEILRFAEVAFKRAKSSGVKIIVFGSGGSRSIPEGFSKEEATKQFVELCKQMGPIASKYKVIVVIEPLNTKECNFINSVAEGGEIVKAVNHRNIRLLADLYHMKMDGEGPENIIKYGKLLRHVHIAEKEGRSAPGTHGEDFTPYFDALKQVKYKGAISIECKWQDMEKQAAVAYRTILSQWNA
ncbi:MAG: sugar phosphate isomerase/epimerase, partial [Mangrovibacterium sp.]|nr:sugar phosphate isomerase/epimerase [Mangrovibacterium sp.]